MPSTAAAFQKAGITALIYDPRGVGLSDGYPRNDINPPREVDDISDAITFLSNHASVNARHGIGLWGMSHGAAVAMVCAALDPRARFVIAVCPSTEPNHKVERFRKILAKAAKDRESRLKGNEPFYLPMLNKDGESPVGTEAGFEKETITRMFRAHDDNDTLRAALAPNHVNRTTIQTYRHMLLWDPRHMWEIIQQPTLFVVPEHDQLIGMSIQLKHYARLRCPKRLHVQDGAAHMDILEGPSQSTVNQLQVDFIQDALAGRVTTADGGE